MTKTLLPTFFFSFAFINLFGKEEKTSCRAELFTKYHFGSLENPTQRVYTYYLTLPTSITFPEFQRYIRILRVCFFLPITTRKIEAGTLFGVRRKCLGQWVVRSYAPKYVVVCDITVRIVGGLGFVPAPRIHVVDDIALVCYRLYIVFIDMRGEV